MKIDSQKIVQRRVSRAWSQQQLADVAEINLRTIQRIEGSGNASHESIQAIASAFDQKPDVFILEVVSKIEDKNRFDFRLQERVNSKETRVFLSGLIFCLGVVVILAVTLNPTNAIADDKYYFQGNLIIDKEVMQRYQIEIPSRSIYMIPLESDFQLIFIAPDDKSSEKFSEARLTRRNGATSYEILHAAKISISAIKDRTFSLSYRVCGVNVIFYNHDKNDIPVCTESELAI